MLLHLIHSDKSPFRTHFYSENSEKLKISSFSKWKIHIAPTLREQTDVAYELDQLT